MSAASLTFGMMLSVIDKASAPLKAVAKVFGELGTSAEGLKKSAETLRIARENVDDFTNRAKAGLQSILGPALEVDAALARVAADAGPKLNAATGDLQKLKDASIAWSQAHVQSATQYLQEADLIMKAGLNQTDAMKATEAALRVSTATGKDSAAVTETLIALYQQVGDKTKDAGAEFARLGDVVTKASQTFAGFDAGALIDPLKDALPAAKGAGVSIEQLVAIIGQLNASGLKGGEAGAAFADMMQHMNDASKQLGFSLVKTKSGGLDMVATLAAMQKKFGSISSMTPEMAAKLQAAFGPAGFKVLSATLGSTAQLSDNLTKLTNSSNAAADASSKIEGSDGAQLQIAQQQLDALKITLAAGLLPAIKSMIPYVHDAVDAIGGFVKEHPQLIAFVGTIFTMAVAVGSVLGPLLSLGGAIASVGGTIGTAIAGTSLYASVTDVGLIPALGAATAEAWAFAAAMLANPITWIVLAIVALAAVLYIYWDPISKFFVDLWAKIKVAFAGTWTVILQMWDALKAATRVVVDFLVVAWDKVVGFFTGAFSNIKNAFHESFIKGVLTVLSYTNPLAILVRIWSAIIPYMIQLWSFIGQLVWKGLVALGGLVAAGLGKVWAWIKDGFHEGILTGLERLFLAVNPVVWLLAWYNQLTEWLFGMSLLEVGKHVFGTLLDAVFWVQDETISILGDILSAVWDFFGTGIENDLQGIWEAIKALLSGEVEALMAILAAMNPLTIVQGAWQEVTDWFAGFSLADAGANIVNTIVDGMKSAASGPADAMKGIVQDVRNLLPFSPAKEGPLSDLHQVKLVQTVADGMKPGPMVNAMTDVTGQTMNALQKTTPSSPILAPMTMPTMPTVAPPPGAGMSNPASSGGANPGAGGGAVQMTVTIQVGGSSDKSVLDNMKEWLADPENARQVYVAVQHVAGNEQRKELG